MPKMYKHKCEYCGIEYEISQDRENRLISGKIKHCFCSSDCHNNFQKKNKIKCICENCGEITYKSKSQFNKSANHFCSNKCADEFRHNNLTEERICPICGDKFIVGKKSKQKYCSIKCQGKWQSTIIGKLNPRFKSVEIECEYCKKLFYTNLYRYNNGQLKFCDANCRRKWYSEIFSQTEQWKEESRKRALDMMHTGAFSKTNSKPQQIIDSILEQNKIEYNREYIIEYYSIDNYLSKYDLFLEIQGDYWHCNPNIYNDSINKTQFNRIKKDKAKHTYVHNKYNRNILYIWENDIINNSNLCEQLIKHFIENNGVLKNYNSFNYYLDNDNCICLNEKLITPYQEQNVDTYRNLVKVS